MSNVTLRFVSGRKVEQVSNITAKEITKEIDSYNTHKIIENINTGLIKDYLQQEQDRLKSNLTLQELENLLTAIDGYYRIKSWSKQ
jgi:hypothetical protein